MKEIELSKVYEYSDNLNIGTKTKEAYQIKFVSDDPLHLSFSLEKKLNSLTGWHIIITMTHHPKMQGHHYGRIGGEELDFDCDWEFEAEKVFKTFTKLFRQMFAKRFYSSFQKEKLCLLLNVAWNLVQLDLEI
jgi:hypothetical protein